MDTGMLYRKGEGWFSECIWAKVNHSEDEPGLWKSGNDELLSSSTVNANALITGLYGSL